MITLLIVLLVLAAILCIAWTVYRQDQLDELQEELEKMSVHLDERANRIAADEATLTLEWQMLRKARQEMEEHAKRTARSADHTRH